jgi:hypothetical protein
MAARRKPGRGRSSLLTSGEKLHTRLARIEELQGHRGRRTYVFMPRHDEMKPVAFPDGEGPERGDLCIVFEPLHATAAEAAMSLQEFGERYRQKADLAPVELPWKRDLGHADPPTHRDPDPELEALAESRTEPNVRPLESHELRDATDRLLRTGNLFSSGVVRGALSGGTVPLDGDQFPCAEFATSDKGTTILRMRQSAERAERWREATDRDRGQWPAAFGRFLAQLSPTFATTTTTTTEDDDR